LGFSTKAPLRRKGESLNLASQLAEHSAGQASGIALGLEPVTARISACAEAHTAEQIAVIRAALPSYVNVPHQPLADSIMRNIRRVVATLLDARDPAPAEVHEAWVARERAGQGVPPSDVLRAYQLSLGMLRDLFIALANELRVDPVAIMQGIHLLWRLTDTVTMCLIEVRREVDLEQARSDEQQRLDFLRRLLFGSTEPSELYNRGAVYGLALDREYLAFRARPREVAATEVLKQQIEASCGVQGAPPLVGIIDGDVAGIASRRPTTGTLVATIGVGALVGLEQIEDSFVTASRVLDAALALRRIGTVGLDDLSLRAAIVSEPELGTILARRYVVPLQAEGAFGALLEHTVSQYLLHGQQIGATAQALAVHPNTLRYRLARFEELTGSKLSEPLCLLEVWWALEYAAFKRLAGQASG
jgi:putative transposase